MSIRLECIRCNKVAPTMSSYTDEGLCPDCANPMTPAERALVGACERNLGSVDAFGVSADTARRVVVELRLAGFEIVSMEAVDAQR